MFKKLISIGTILVMVWMMTSASLGAQSGTVKLSLEQAIDIAVENDQTLKLTDEKIKLAERRYNTAIAISKDAPSKYWGSDAQHISNKNEELLYPLQREADLNELKWKKQNLESKLRIDVTKLFYQILQKQLSLENQKSIISRAKVEYDSMKKKVQSGILTDSALLSYEILVSEAETTLKAIQRDLDNLNINLNEKLGFALDVVVVLSKTELPAENLNIASIDKLVADVVAASHDIKKLESDKLIDKTKYDILYQNSYNTPAECETLENDLLNYDYSIRDKKVAVELKVRVDYNNLLNLMDDITIRKLDYDQKVKLLEIEKKRHELGLSTYLDYVKVQGNVDAALVDLCGAQLNYYVAVQDFKLYIDPVKMEV